jgi:hypothetical protein
MDINGRIVVFKSLKNKIFELLDLLQRIHIKLIKFTKYPRIAYGSKQERYIEWRRQHYLDKFEREGRLLRYLREEIIISKHLRRGRK